MDFPLILRVAVLYPLGGALGAYFGFVDFDEASGLLTVDLNAASVMLGLLVSGAVSGGTFWWSRQRKATGGAT